MPLPAVPAVHLSDVFLATDAQHSRDSAIYSVTNDDGSKKRIVERFRSPRNLFYQSASSMNDVIPPQMSPPPEIRLAEEHLFKPLSDQLAAIPDDHPVKALYKDHIPMPEGFTPCHIIRGHSLRAVQAYSG